MRATVFVTFALLAGCASALERVQEVSDKAPEWYQARKVELSGEGYPSIGDVPQITPVNRPGKQLPLSRAQTLAAQAKFERDPRAKGAEETAAQMLAWAAEARRAVEGQVPAPDFLTDADVAALKAIFTRGRGRL